MITIVYSTHKDENYNNKFRQHLLQTVGLKDVQILEYQNNNEFSLTEVYNKGISESNFNIVICCHNDIKLEKGWGKKLLGDFNENPEFGIIGKAGTCYFPESGVYWERMNQTMVGQVYHQPPGQKKWLSSYSVKSPDLIEVVSIDGLFISFDKTKIKHKFDESYGKFHFYDHGFCVPNFIDGVKIGVTNSFDIIHESVGRPSQEFFESKDRFVEKYKDVLPIDLKPTKILIPQIKEKPIKNIGKVAIIIPTKGKVEMLYSCVESFYIHCNSELFDIFIADTGSTDDEKLYIKTNILPMGNIKLIEYDYYNFAKINNDVVNNYLSEEYEFLLFSNNDIKILNNVIYGMLKSFKTDRKIGTLGVRLHFGDNTIQHNGILLYVSKNNTLNITHLFLKNYHNYNQNLTEVVGNTAGLMMVKRDVFVKIGGFNEGYISCFEDVEFNIECLKLGYLNYCDGSLVGYHYESQTRKDEDILNSVNEDFKMRILPKITKEINILHKYIIKIK
jgi:GT2 family glycosyltransferase